MGVAPSKKPEKSFDRGEVVGWTRDSIRRNTKFLYTVDETQLDGWGYALTLTVRDCPADHDKWRKMRESLFARFRRLGMIRLHWVTEWQRRGVPHLHVAIWFPESKTINELVGPWLDLAGHDFGTKARGQHVTPIHEAIGWFQYVSKHASRGLGHYQRSPENVPQSWAKTGRIWGKLGSWGCQGEIRMELSDSAFFAFRRIVKGWRLARARASGDRYRILTAKRMLQSSDPVLGSLRGVNEWIEFDVQVQIVAWLRSQGYAISH